MTTRNPLTEIARLQVEAQGQVKAAKYRAAAGRRDAVIAKLTARERANAKLAFGVLDRLLNPVRVR